MTAQIEQGEDYLAHYGKKGMKWGERKAARKAENDTIHNARAKQGIRRSELNTLTLKRLNARTANGKAHIDQKIADKKFEILNHPDAATAAKLTSGEKWMKGGRVAAMMGLSVVGLGAAANIAVSEMNYQDNKGRGAELTRQFQEEIHRQQSPVGNADGG